jgi:hypothetical protein
METVRDLSWRIPQIADEPLQASPVTEKEGFEPSFPPSPHGQRAGTQYGAKGVSWDDGDDA